MGNTNIVGVYPLTIGRMVGTLQSISSCRMAIERGDWKSPVNGGLVSMGNSSNYKRGLLGDLEHGFYLTGA